VPRLLPPALLAALIFTACSREPVSFAPPPQRTALIVPQPGALGHFVSMADANADAYIVQDVATSGPGTWRWAYAHPVLRFVVPDVPRLKFNLDFSLPERNFRETGPVTLTFRIDGRVLDRFRCERAGQLQYAHDVPAEWLKVNAVNLVAIDPDPVWVSKTDEGRLGFILSRAGFTE
jgi:hypothetical protein